MRIRDVELRDVVVGRNWRLQSDSDVGANMIDWEIEDAPPQFRPDETVVYAGVTVFEDGEVRPILVIREVGTNDWWGDTCEFVERAWRELGPENGRQSESYVASPLPNDPSFVGAYSPETQRSGFVRWVNRVASARRGMGRGST